MAIWQVTVGLIPRAWVEQDGNHLEMLFDAEGYIDMVTAWKTNQPSADLVALISQLLPPTESWDDEMRIWGDQTKSDIHVDFDGDNVESVMARIDTRDDPLHMCSRIVELALALDCYLFLPAAGSIVMADLTALSTTVQNSVAARFSAAPREFIGRLSSASPGES